MYFLHLLWTGSSAKLERGASANSAGFLLKSKTSISHNSLILLSVMRKIFSVGGEGWSLNLRHDPPTRYNIIPIISMRKYNIILNKLEGKSCGKLARWFQILIYNIVYILHFNRFG